MSSFFWFEATIFPRIFPSHKRAPERETGKPLEAAFKLALEPGAVDPNKAPNPLCKALAQAVVAESKRDMAGFLAAARALYPQVKDYDTKKTPFGRAVLLEVLRNRGEGFDKIDFQAEVVADQLKQLDPAHVRQAQITYHHTELLAMHETESLSAIECCLYIVPAQGHELR